MTSPLPSPSPTTPVVVQQSKGLEKTISMLQDEDYEPGCWDHVVDGWYMTWDGLSRMLSGETSLLSSKPPIIRPKRRVFVNMPLPDSYLDLAGFPTVTYPTNKIRTSKYTIWTFLPKFLFEQFRRIANIFFLVMAISQAFPIFTITNPVTPFFPLMVILFLTGIKDGWEDWQRHKADKKLNHTPTYVITPFNNVNYFDSSGEGIIRRTWWTIARSLAKLPGFESCFGEQIRQRRVQVQAQHQQAQEEMIEINRAASMVTNPVEQLVEGWGQATWADVRVGDFVMLKNNDPVPADIVILSTSEEDNVAHVETKNLDGETNLKSKQGPSQTSNFNKASMLRQTKFWLDSESPNPNLYTYTGLLVIPPEKIDDHIPTETSLPPEIPEIVVRQPTFTMDHSLDNTTLPLETPTSDFPTLSTLPPLVPDATPAENSYMPFSAAPKASPRPSTENASRTSMDSISKSTARVSFASGTVDRPRMMSTMSRFTLGRRRSTLDRSIPPGSAMVPLNLNNLLLRGSVVRNTEWVMGIVAYTGNDTKILLNAGQTPSKRTRVERIMNQMVLLNFLILFIMCLAVTIGHMLELKKWGNVLAPYYNSAYPSSVQVGFITFWSSVILFQNLVPISIYITIEIAKTVQAFFIYQDIDLYYAPDDAPCIPKNWSIADDMGQIQYIFSDKTGTLTMNKMEFKYATIDGRTYGTTPATSSEQSESSLSFFDSRLNAILESSTPEDADEAQKIASFGRCLALCHTVAAPKPDKDGKLVYSAESPDELALVNAAKDMGFEFKNRTQKTVTINARGELQQWELLNILEFNSTRKRMSIIVKKHKTGNNDSQILLLCKGADSIIAQRLLPQEAAKMLQTSEDLEVFATQGLRTLCLAQRELTEQEYQTWLMEYTAASTALQNRDQLLDESYELIEQNLTLLGATAIEDRLQDQVPESIATLRQAGIKIWVLTGDKLETAINIGYSCNLLSNQMTLLVVRNANDIESAKAQVKEAMKSIAVHDPEFVALTEAPVTPAVEHGSIRSRNRSQARSENRQLMTVAEAADEAEFETGSHQFGLVVDGDSLHTILADKATSLEFLKCALRCRSVVCCRVSPKQKALVVHLVKSNLNAMCLSIGDGANDVGMIQEANVGVGIAGAEGLQAAMSSDYVINQFRFLVKLLLVHGRWSYVRCANMVLNFFYKSFVWVIAQFWFQIYNGWSTELLYDYTYILFYNLVFSSLPVLVMGIFEQDVKKEYCMKMPQLYEFGIRRTEFTLKRLCVSHPCLTNSQNSWWFVLDGVYQSLVVFYVVYFTYLDSSLKQGYGSDDKYLVSNAVAIYAIVLVNIYVGLNIHNWTAIVWVIVLLSCASPFIFLPIYGLFPSEIQGNFVVLFNNAFFWFGLGLALSIGLIPSHVCKYLRAVYWPKDNDIAREMQFAKIPPYEPPPYAEEGYGQNGMVNGMSNGNVEEKHEMLQVPPSLPTLQVQGEPPNAESWFVASPANLPPPLPVAVGTPVEPTASVTSIGNLSIDTTQTAPATTRSLPRTTTAPATSGTMSRARSMSPTRAGTIDENQSTGTLRRKSYIYDVSQLNSPMSPLSIHTGYAFSQEDKSSSPQ